MDSVIDKITLAKNLRPVVRKIRSGIRISPQDALVLYSESPLFLLSELASKIKYQKSGNEVYYNKNFHIEPTNVCVFHCKFCSYRRPSSSPQAWNMTPDEISTFAERFRDVPVTEVHIVGGVHPGHTLFDYAEMIRRVRQVLPHVTIKAFSAVELIYMIEKAEMTYTEGLSLLKDAGMQTLPGGGAEIFDETVRSAICPEKASAEKWLELHKTAHRLAIPTNATMLYGHIERIEHRIEHMERLRGLQDETGGFNAFIPLKFRSMNNELADMGETSVVDDLKTLALSRIFLDNFPHIKAYWPMYGKQTTRTALLFGADDVDGTIHDTTKIYAMAGAEDSAPQMTESELKHIISGAGFIPVERDSFYRAVARK